MALVGGVLAVVIGGTSAEACLKTVKLASARALDGLPVHGHYLRPGARAANEAEDLTVFENLELSLPRGRNVAGALFWKRTEEGGVPIYCEAARRRVKRP